MMSLNFNLGVQRLLTLGRKVQSLETLDSGARLYHYVKEDEHEKSRVHLRVDSDGTGTLIVNANRVLHLNPTATLMTHMMLEGKEDREIIKSVSKQYQVAPSQ